MNKYNPIFYLLFILLVMGAFAAMAQNNYGLIIMGGVAFVFGIVFLIRLVSALVEEGKKDIYALMELSCLFLLSFIFGLRVFYIHFPYVEILFSAAGTLLAIIYLRKMINSYHQMKDKNKSLAMLVVVFHLTIIFFLFSLVILPFLPLISEVTGAGALILLMVFIVTAVSQKRFFIDGQYNSAFNVVTTFKDHSIVIISLFLLFSMYFGFNKMGLLPGIYSEEYPKAYFELVNNSVLKKEKADNGKYKHEEFKDKYDQLLKSIDSKKE
jgi:hypothetical protein